MIAHATWSSLRDNMYYSRIMALGVLIRKSRKTKSGDDAMFNTLYKSSWNTAKMKAQQVATEVLAQHFILHPLTPSLKSFAHNWIMRSFHSSAKAFLKWAGFKKEKLEPRWQSSIEHFSKPGGTAEMKLGPLKEIYIKSRDGDPVHQSHFNREDKEWVISARIKGQFGTKTCHIYEDGTGTTKKGDDRC